MNQLLVSIGLRSVEWKLTPGRGTVCMGWMTPWKVYGKSSPVIPKPRNCQRLRHSALQRTTSGPWVRSCALARRPTSWASSRHFAKVSATFTRIDRVAFYLWQGFVCLITNSWSVVSLLFRSISANHQPSGRLPAAESPDFLARTDPWPASTSPPSRHCHLSRTLPLPEPRADGWPAQPTLWHHGALPHLPPGQRSALWLSGTVLWWRPCVRWPGIWPASKSPTQHQRKLLVLQARGYHCCRIRQEFLLQCALWGRRTWGTCHHLWQRGVQPTVQWAAGRWPDGLWWTLTPWTADECPVERHLPRLLKE